MLSQLLPRVEALEQWLWFSKGMTMGYPQKEGKAAVHVIFVTGDAAGREGLLGSFTGLHTLPEE